MKEIILVAILAGSLVGGYWLATEISLNSSTQTASATTDYFSWSCQQLQNQVNAYLDEYPNANLYAAVNGDLIKANTMVGIMQLKGCNVSP